MYQMPNLESWRKPSKKRLYKALATAILNKELDLES
jgi:hypothetical protein